MTKRITSAANPIARRVRSLANRKHRKREGMFLVEGMQPVWRAAESGWTIDTLLIAPDLITNAAAIDMADTLRNAGTTVVEFGAELFTRLSERDGPAGVMAIVQTQTTSLADLAIDANSCFIILHRTHNPGNLGTIIRTADAAGCAGVILTGDTTDPFAPAAVKASMGSLFALPIVIERSFDAVYNWASGSGVRLIATSGYASSNHWDAEWTRPLGILLGNEGDGLPEGILARADERVRIPMTGTAESLNLSVAAAILMYEVQRKRIE